MKKKPDLRCRTSCRVTEVLRNSQVKVALGPFGKIPLRNGKFPLPAKRIEPVRLIYAAILTTELMRLLVLCCVVFFFFFFFSNPNSENGELVQGPLRLAVGSGDSLWTMGLQ
jgi:hypothetical protein